MNQRTGILGGTFDPVHNAHLRIAEIARDFCRLHEVCFVPACVPPHKDCTAVAGFHHRAAMIELALADRPGFTVSTIEADLPEPSYTIDTLRNLHAHTAIGADFFFIIGTDAFLSIRTWKSYQLVLQTTHFIVIQRMGTESTETGSFLLSLGYKPHTTSLTWSHPAHSRKIFFPPTIVPDISSSQIRQDVMRKKPIDYAVCASVREYIRTHNLYT